MKRAKRLHSKGLVIPDAWLLLQTLRDEIRAADKSRSTRYSTLLNRKLKKFWDLEVRLQFIQIVDHYQQEGHLGY